MLRDNLAGLIEPMLSSAGACPLAVCTDRNESSDDRPQNALKIPARQGGIYALTENVPSPFHAELGHRCLRLGEPGTSRKHRKIDKEAVRIVNQNIAANSERFIMGP